MPLLLTWAAAVAQGPSAYEPTEQDVAQEAAGRFADYRARGEAAQSRGNLREALEAYEAALAASRDAALERAAAALREQVNAHDDALAEGKDLARDPDTLEEAIEAYGRAREAWASAEAREALTAARRELARFRAAERERPPSPATPAPDPTPLPVGPVISYPVETFVPAPYGPPPVQILPLIPPFDPVGIDPFGLRFNTSGPLNHRIAGLLLVAGEELAAEGALAEAVRVLERALALLPQAPLVITRLAELRRRLAAAGGGVRSGGLPWLVLAPFDVRGAPASLALDLPERLSVHLERNYRLIMTGRASGWVSRLGVGFGELAADPAVRRELDRALDVRCLSGTVRPDAAGLVATASLTDAATGQRRSVREVRAKSAADLLARAAELVR